MSRGLYCWAVLATQMLYWGCEPAPVRTSTASADKPAPKTKSPVASSDGTPQIRFEDRTAVSQIDFDYQNDEVHSNYSILESLGGGVGILDYDEDGRLDVFFPGGGTFGHRATKGRRSAMYRNTGDWHFVDVTHPAEVGESKHYSHGTAVADVDNDGFKDVLLTGYGGLALFQNQGDGTFIEISDQSGLNDNLWSSSAAWGDFNGDGILDLFVAHYCDWSFDNNPPCVGAPGHPSEVCPPLPFKGLPDTLYFGNGDGTFLDASKETGILPDGKGLGVVAADLDFDGDLDLYVSNDTVPNFLYRNDGRGKFDEIGQVSGTALSDIGTPDGSMGVDIGDFNGDGLPDIWVANYERENNALYRNLDKGQFRHVSQSIGITAIGAKFVGWGTRFIDADLDGDEDLIVSNGHVVRFPANSPRRQTPLVLENREGKRFFNVSNHAGTYFVSGYNGRGLATGDLDGDGDEDVVISRMNEPAAILSNESSHRHNWLTIRMIGRRSDRTSIGGTAVAKIGTKSLLRIIRGGSSYASSCDSRLHFGCGTDDRIDELTVRWISGSQTVLTNIACNQVLTIIEGENATYDVAGRSNNH